MWRIRISGINDQVSWQDLKDFCKNYGDAVYTENSGNGEG